MSIITRKEAAQQGLSRYYTGKPCPHGHLVERYTSNHKCVTCAAEHAKLPRSKAQMKARYERIKDTIRQQTKEYLDKNPEIKEKRKQYLKKWRLENKERHYKKCREYAKKNPEKVAEYKKKWAEKNKVYVALNLMKRSEKLKKATPLWSDTERIKTKIKERIYMSRITGLKYHVDHRIPLQGENVCGLHIAANLRVVLARDNLTKSNKLQNTLGLAI